MDTPVVAAILTLVGTVGGALGGRWLERRAVAASAMEREANAGKADAEADESLSRTVDLLATQVHNLTRELRAESEQVRDLTSELRAESEKVRELSRRVTAAEEGRAAAELRAATAEARAASAEARAVSAETRLTEALAENMSLRQASVREQTAALADAD